MKLAMAQMSVMNNMDLNYKKTMDYIARASACDLLLFPQLQMTPYFPQMHGLDASAAVNRESDARINGIAYQAKKNNLYISMNVCLEKDDTRYNASLWFDRYGETGGIAGLRHPLDRKNRHESEYFTPYPGVNQVYRTPFGKVGIVIGSDMHFSECVRSCVIGGAGLILMPAAQTEDQMTEMYEWELRVQAYQNSVWIAVCSRTGKEGKLQFCGASLLIDPNGEIVYRADDCEQLIIRNIDLKEAERIRTERQFDGKGEIR